MAVDHVASRLGGLSSRLQPHAGIQADAFRTSLMRTCAGGIDALDIKAAAHFLGAMLGRGGSRRHILRRLECTGRHAQSADRQRGKRKFTDIPETILAFDETALPRRASTA